ncbi:MAG: rhomboid family intramembrane serine protease [Pseudomonadota bacterium]
MDYLTAFPITSALIAANVIASVVAFNSREFFGQNAFIVGPILKERQYYRVLTSGFLHVAVWHLLFNMYALYGFGAYVERQLGAGAYLFVYVVALLGGNLWSLAEKKGNPAYAAVGASGAISGILLAFGLMAPFAQILAFFVIPMPAIVFCGAFILVSALLAQRQNAMFGHDAHLGGAIAGLFATLVVAPGLFGAFVAEVRAVLGV